MMSGTVDFRHDTEFFLGWIQDVLLIPSTNAGILVKHHRTLDESGRWILGFGYRTPQVLQPVMKVIDFIEGILA